VIFNDVCKLLESNSGILNAHPMEVYHSALILLPNSICEPLARERNNRSLPTVKYGLPETWPPELRPKKWPLYELTETSDGLTEMWLPKEGSILLNNSTSRFLGFSHGRWLVQIIKTFQLVVHEWDCHQNKVSQISLGVFSSTSVKWRMTDCAVFVLDVKANILFLFPLSPLAACTTWNLDPSFADASSAWIDVSDNGAIVAVMVDSLERIKPEYLSPLVCLIDVQTDTYKWLAMHITDVEYNPSSEMKSVFSPDGSIVALFRQVVY